MASPGERIETPEDSSAVTLSVYFIGAFTISWTLWAPVAFMFPDNAALPAWAILLAIAGCYGPSLAAISAALIRGGTSELRAFLARRFKTRVGWWWYVIVVFGPPAFVWSGAIVHVLMGGHVRLAGMQGVGRAALILATFVPFGPLGEELGWRGYALPKLEAHFSPLISSLVPPGMPPLFGFLRSACHNALGTRLYCGQPIRCPSLSFSAMLHGARITAFRLRSCYMPCSTGEREWGAVLVASASDTQAIQRWSQFVQWLVVIAAAIALARSRENDRRRQGA